MTPNCKKTLFIFESNQAINAKSINYITNNGGSFQAVVLDNHISESDQTIEIKQVSDYYDLNELRENLESACTSILKNIYDNAFFKSVFTVNNVYFLKLVREDLGFILSSVIKKVLMVERLISEVKPSEIIIFGHITPFSASIPIPTSKIVSAVSIKYSIPVSVRGESTFARLLNVKKLMLPSYFFKRQFKIYTLVRVKSMFWSDLKNRSKETSAMKKVLCIPYSDAEKVSMEPVIAKLCSLENITCLAIPYPDDDLHVGLFENRWKRYRASEVPIFAFGEYWPKNTSAMNKTYKEVMNAWNNYKTRLYSSEILKLGGVDLAEIIKEKLEMLFKYWMKECMQYFFVSKEMFMIEKPDVILIAKERWSFIRCFLEAASQEKIPTVLIQHGIYSDGWLQHDSINVQTICADNSYKDILVKGGENSGKIIVTGSPRHDVLFHNKNVSTFTEKGPQNVKRKTLCFLTSLQPEWDTPEKREELLEELIESSDMIDYDLVIKLHPRENKAKMQDLADKAAEKKHSAHRVKVISFEDADLNSVIMRSDLVVALHSSANIPVLLAGKPLIIINYDSRIADFFPDIEKSIFGVAKSNAHLRQLIISTKIDPLRVQLSLKTGREYARKYVPYEDATQRVVNVLLLQSIN